jgi:hypothetical protein
MTSASTSQILRLRIFAAIGSMALQLDHSGLSARRLATRSYRRACQPARRIRTYPARQRGRPQPSARSEAQRKIRDRAWRRGGSSPATRKRQAHGLAHGPAQGVARCRPAGVAQTTWDIYARLRRQGPSTQRRFEHAKGMTRATCHGEQAMCVESFGKTDASGPAHSRSCLAFSPSSSVRKVFRCTCGRGTHRPLLRTRHPLLPRKGGATPADGAEDGLSTGFGGWVRLDRYPPITLSAASGVRFAVTLDLKPQDCALSAFLSPSRERCGRFRVCTKEGVGDKDA